MTENEALEYIQGLLRFGIRPGLERIAMLTDRLSHPERGLAIVHVAGTSGKGSTCTMIAQILAASGYRTGLYTSPYVLDFRERIQVLSPGQPPAMIPAGDLTRWTERVKAAADTLPEPATEFELITALAFGYFAEAKVDVVVLETGLGGRYDATNVISPPLCAVITPIGFDHMDVLGDTIEKIAGEKCGIIKPGSAVVSAPAQRPGALAVIRDTAEKRHTALTVPDMRDVEIKAENFSGTDFTYRGAFFHVGLCGRHQVQNAVTAVETARALRSVLPGITKDSVAAGLAAAVLPARQEVLREEPLLLLDGAHNVEKMEALRDSIVRFLPGRRVVFVVGMMADKEVEKTLTLLVPLSRVVIAVDVDNPRAMPAAALAGIAARLGADARTADSYAGALTLAGSFGLPVVVTGSLYLASAIRDAALDFIRRRPR